MFEKALAELKSSKIPTIIYAPPLDEFYYTDPNSMKELQNVLDYLGVKETELKDTNIRIIKEIPKSIRKTLPFCADGFHLKSTGKLDEYLAEQIWHSVKQYGMIKK